MTITIERPVAPSYPEMTAEWRVITPDDAITLLAYRARNRRLSPARVETLARKMADGNFPPDGATIRISATGELLDGQHRLSAVVKCGIPQMFLVVSGVDPATLINIDTGRPRSFSDWLTIKDVPNATQMAAATSHLWRYQKGIFCWKGDITKAPYPTQDDLWKVWVENRQAFQEIGPVVRKMRRTVKINGSAAIGMWPVLSGIDWADAEEFYGQLAGMSTPQSDAVIALRIRLNNAGESKYGPVLNARSQTAYLIKTWNYYRRGDIVQVVRWVQGGAKPEGWPEPI